jgi:Na+/H+ antiporter NhaD/arsenite permease-like protein
VSIATRAIIIFAFTYALISVQKLRHFHHDRPSAALFGAVMMVIAGVLTLNEAYRAINMDTIVLLLGMMILVAYLKVARFFLWASHWILTSAKTPRRLLVLLVFSSGAASALFVNDTICLMFTPILLEVTRQGRLSPMPYLIALATSANIGSVVTLTGNPQNMLIGVFSHWSYLRFTAYMLPIGILSLLVDILLILIIFRRDITSTPFQPLSLVPPRANLRLIVKCLIILGCMLVGFSAHGRLPLVAVLGGVLLIAWANMRPARALEQVDWSLLLFFSGLFVVVQGVNKVGLVHDIYVLVSPLFSGVEWVQIVSFSAVSMALSNVVSNVPFVLVAREWIGKFFDPDLMWLVLAMSSTFAGNLTIVGSVANMIVAELSKEEAPLRFVDFLKVGLPVTLITTAIGAVTIMLYARFL